MKLTYTFNEQEIEQMLATEGMMNDKFGPNVSDGSYVPGMLLSIIKACLPEKCKRRGVNWKLINVKLGKTKVPSFNFENNLDETSI